MFDVEMFVRCCESIRVSFQVFFVLVDCLVVTSTLDGRKTGQSFLQLEVLGIGLHSVNSYWFLNWAVASSCESLIVFFILGCLLLAVVPFVTCQFHFLEDCILELLVVAALTPELFNPPWHLVFQMFLKWFSHSSSGREVHSCWNDSVFVKEFASFELALIRMLNLPWLVVNSNSCWQ